MTVSIHKHARGFFPSTGALEERGRGKGKYFTMNLPLRVRARRWSALRRGVPLAARARSCPARSRRRCRVVRRTARCARCLTAWSCAWWRCSRRTRSCCSAARMGWRGAPASLTRGNAGPDLASRARRDPCRALNLTPRALAHCVRKLRETGTPLLVLGGGGYNSADTARAWAAATAAAIGPHAEAALPGDVPDHEYFPCYGPDFRMDVRAREGVVDENAGEGLTQLVAAGLDHVAELAERLRGRR